MKLRNMIGLAAIGGFIYYHQRRGGQFTLAGFKQSARELFGRGKAEAQDLAGKAERVIEDYTTPRTEPVPSKSPTWPRY